MDIGLFSDRRGGGGLGVSVALTVLAVLAVLPTRNNSGQRPWKNRHGDTPL